MEASGPGRALSGTRGLSQSRGWHKRLWSEIPRDGLCAVALCCRDGRLNGKRRTQDCCKVHTERSGSQDEVRTRRSDTKAEYESHRTNRSTPGTVFQNQPFSTRHAVLQNQPFSTSHSCYRTNSSVPGMPCYRTNHSAPATPCYLFSLTLKGGLHNVA